MYLYIFLICCILLISILYKVKFINKLCYLVLVFFPLVYVQGGRKILIGYDTRFYEHTFLTFYNIPFSSIIETFPKTYVFDHYQSVETGYLLFNRLVGIFTNNPQVLLYIVACISCFCFLKFIYDNSLDPFWSVIILVCEGLYVNSFNMMRQILAISICLNAYTLFKKDKIFWSLIIIVIAAQLHASSYIFLFILLMYWAIEKVNENFRKYFLVLPLIMPFVLDIIGHIVPQYSGYTSGNLYDVSIGGISILWAIMIVISFMPYSENKSNVEYIFSLTCYLIYVVLQILSIYITGTARISYWFEGFIMLLIPLSFAKLNNNLITLFLKMVLLSLLVLAYISFCSALVNNSVLL